MTGHAIATVAAMLLLSFERIFYLIAWYFPERIQQVHSTAVFKHSNSPTDVIKYAFYFFKLLQLGVFAGWWFYFSKGTWTLTGMAGVAAVFAFLAIAIGQVLNFAVFLKLGERAVFYGNKFGYRVSWQNGFPFNYISHPQYVGTVLSIWGLFALMRFPNEDWWIVPAIETVYYTVGARLEK